MVDFRREKLKKPKVSRFGSTKNIESGVLYDNLRMLKNVNFSLSNWRVTLIDHPMSGKDLKDLQGTLVLKFHKINDLDLAMLMNVPPLRIAELKNAPPGGRKKSSEEGRVIKPHQAILIRLLLKHPEYTPLIPRPSSIETWQAIKPFMPKPVGLGNARKDQDGKILGFSPLFGRSATSSYKVLTQGFVKQEPGTNVVRLYMLVLGKFGQIFRTELFERLEKHVAKDLIAEVRRDIPKDWQVIRDEEHWAKHLPKNVKRELFQEVFSQRSGWMDLYLSVLYDEAVSRDLDPKTVLFKGNWKNQDDVDQKKIRSYESRQRPILGTGSIELEGFKDQFGLTGSEFYWVLGMQVKSYFRAKSKERKHKRLDAPTSILLRYLWRQPKDISLFIPKIMSGQEMLDYIQEIDPTFKKTHLGPLMGGAHVVSYHLIDKGMRPLARRLSAIFAEQKERRDDFYRILRNCVEEEVTTRGIDVETFWQEGNWNS
jgi:hypothetical protein